VVYDADLEQLVARLLEAYCTEHHRRRSCFCADRVGFLNTESYFATAGNEHARKTVQARECGWPMFAAYRARLDQYLEDKTRTASDSTVNRLRRAVLDACRIAAQQSPGLFTLTVPTGGGRHWPAW
jgi:CRISPR-associated endonuclease/helicase Cas3